MNLDRDVPNQTNLGLPLEGVRVLALSQFGAGPYATLNLADLGAEVIKIEDATVGGDISRFVSSGAPDDDGLYFESWNRNKRSITLNLRIPEGRQVFHDLVRVADVVLNNLRGDKPRQLGLTYECLGRMNPRIVCCSLNNFGSEGPRAAEPGYDYLIQAYAGYMSLTGDPSGPPVASGVSFIDHAAGFAAALGTVSALYSAKSSGVGRNVEVSLIDTGYSMLTYLAAWSLNSSFSPIRRPGSSHQTIVPAGTFRTADGYLSLFCGKEKFWHYLRDTFADPLLENDPRFANAEARAENREVVMAVVQQYLSRKSTKEWVDLLRGHVPCAPVRDLGEALADPEMEAHGTVIGVKHPTLGIIREVNTPVRCSGAQVRHRCAPRLGEDTQFVLTEYLHYSDAKIKALRAVKAV